MTILFSPVCYFSPIKPCRMLQVSELLQTVSSMQMIQKIFYIRDLTFFHACHNRRQQNQQGFGHPKGKKTPFINNVQICCSFCVVIQFPWTEYLVQNSFTEHSQDSRFLFYTEKQNKKALYQVVWNLDRLNNSGGISVYGVYREAILM